MPYVSCPCGVRVWVNRTEGGFRKTWTPDAVNGCAEMRKLRALEPDKQDPINCDRSMAASRPPQLHTAPQSTPGLSREILEENSIHGAFEANMKLADLAFCQRDHTHSCKHHLFVERGDVLLIATNAIKSLCNHNVELTITHVR